MRLNFATVALTGLLLVAFAIPGFNIYHHFTIPNLSFHQITTSYTWNVQFPFVHKTSNIYLESEIHSQIFYTDILETLTSAEKGDTVVFHLSGYGGSVQTCEYLINTIKTSKANVVMHVEAPVYSAHAYLALSGNELIMDNYSYLMFHMSSIMNTDCSTEAGSDRGVSNVEHCEMLKKEDLSLNVKIVLDMPILTAEEKESMFSGHDVYVSADEVNRRLHNG